MKTNTKQLKVDSAQSMELMISSYIAQGFEIAYRSEKVTTLRKPKKFRVGLAVLLFILYIIPLIIYIIIYASKPDAEAVEIIVSSEETPDISYSPTTQTVISDTLESSTPQTMAPKALESPEKNTDALAITVFSFIGGGALLIGLIAIINTTNQKNDSTTARIERTAEPPSTANQKISAQKMIAAREGYVAMISNDAKRDGLTYKIHTEGLISDTLVFEHPLYADRNTARDLQFSAIKDVWRDLGFKKIIVRGPGVEYSYAVSGL